MSSITGIVNVDNTLTGVEDLFLDELDVTNVVADAISLGGADLQTTLTDLQNQITAGGGYFVITCEHNANATNGTTFFGFGAGTTTSLLRTLLPNSTCIGYRYECQTALTATAGIVVLKNGSSVSALNATFVAGDTLKQVITGISVDFNLGDFLSVRFGSTSGSAGGTAWRLTFVFETAPVNGTNGTNGTDGQNVSFNVPTIATITPVTASSISDTIVTASGTQTHSLNFNIPRGKNASFVVGTISSVGTASPSLNITGATDANGDNVYTMNFGLQQGIQGNQGAKGDKGDTGDAAASTLAAELSALSALGSAGVAAEKASEASISAGLAASNGAAAGAESGAEAAEGVLSGLETRVSTLEGEMDTQQTKTAYISQSATETTIGGAKTIVNSTNGLLSNTISTTSLSVSNTINTNNLNVTGNNYFAGDILMGDAKKLLTNVISQRQYPAAGDILLDATNLDIGSSFCDSIDLKGDNINITTNSGAGLTTFNCQLVDTDTQVVVEGSLEAKNLNILNNATINNNLLVDQDLTAGTDGDLNEHTFYGTLFTQTIECIDNANPLNIGEDTNELQILSNNIAIGNLDAGATTTTINNKTISIGETLANTEVHIGNTNSKISCNGSTNNITMDTTTFNSNNTTFDVEAQNITLSSDLGSSSITIGSNVNLDTSVYVNTKNINIGTEQTTLTTPKLYMGTITKTDTRVRGKTIQVLATDKTSITGSTDIDIISNTNITLHAPTTNIGTNTDTINIKGDTINLGVDSYTNTINIQGDLINIGTTGVVNTVNVGNAFSSVNINTIDTEYINVDNFFNQLGF